MVASAGFAGVFTSAQVSDAEAAVRPVKLEVGPQMDTFCPFIFATGGTQICALVSTNNDVRNNREKQGIKAFTIRRHKDFFIDLSGFMS
jgi:hypothetical protein